MFSTRYVFMFALAMCAIVAVGLTTLREVTKEQSEINEAIFNKRQILKAVEGVKPVDALADDEVLSKFESVSQKALNTTGEEVSGADILARGYKGDKAEYIDMKKEKKKPESERIFPVFEYNKENNKYYILAIRGNGLWDEIWGYIALESDMNTVAGASFDHQGETPGLGAEIKDNPAFAKMFASDKENGIVKQIYNEKGEYTSILVRKGGAKNEIHEVDGIAGATVTADGVSEMLYRGIKKYEPYFDSVKAANKGSMKN